MSKTLNGLYAVHVYSKRHSAPNILQYKNRKKKASSYQFYKGEINAGLNKGA